MTTQADFNRLLAATYPNAQISAPDEWVDPDEPDDPIRDGIELEVGHRINAEETRLHRPLHDHEVQQITDDVTGTLDNTLRILGRFDADYAHQVQQHERTIGRKLLQSELRGIYAHGLDSLSTRDARFDINDSVEAHWAHAESNGRDRYDLNQPGDVARYMAERVRELEQTEETPEPEADIPDYSSMTSSEANLAMAAHLRARRAGEGQLKRETDPITQQVLDRIDELEHDGDSRSAPR